MDIYQYDIGYRTAEKELADLVKKFVKELSDPDFADGFFDAISDCFEER